MTDTRLTFFEVYEDETAEGAVAKAKAALKKMAPMFTDIHAESISVSFSDTDDETGERVWTAKAFREGVM